MRAQRINKKLLKAHVFPAKQGHTKTSILPRAVGIRVTLANIELGNSCPSGQAPS